VAASGGVVALFLTGTDFSISAAMGFISILGVSIQDALWWSPTRKNYADKASRRKVRLARQPSAGCAGADGLLGRHAGPASRCPLARHRLGTQKPLAIVVIGGALALVILPRLLQPALLSLAFRKRVPAAPQV